MLSHSTRKSMKINKKYCPTQVELAQAKAAGLEDALETVRRENYIQRNKYHTQRILRGRIVWYDEVPANGATWVPKTSKFRTGYKVVKKVLHTFYYPLHHILILSPEFETILWICTLKITDWPKAWLHFLKVMCARLDLGYDKCILWSVRCFVTPWDRVDTIIQNLVTYRAIICIYKMIIILHRDNYPTQVKREKEERRRRREQGKNAQWRSCAFIFNHTCQQFFNNLY